MRASPDCPGVEVTSVAEDSLAWNEGFRPGDRLESWSFLEPDQVEGIPVSGPFCTLFDYWLFNIELRFRGPMELSAWRGDQVATIRIAPGPRSSMRLKQVLDEEVTALWELARALRKDPSAEAAAAWRALLSSAQTRGAPVLEAFFLVERGNGLVRGGEAVQGDRLLIRARSLLEKAGHPWKAAHVERTRSLALEREDPASAGELLAAARAGWLAEGFVISASHADEHSGIQDFQGGRLEEALAHFEDSERLRSRAAAGSGDHAGSLHNEGTALFSLGRIPEAVEHLERARDIYRRYPPHSSLVATLGTLIAGYGAVGEVAKQKEAGEEALALIESLGIGGYRKALVLANHASALVSLGDLAKAEAVARKARGPADESGDPGLRAHVESGLAWIAEQRGDFEVAARAYARAIAIHDETETDRADLALALMSLGVVETELGNYGAAQAHFERAEQIFAKDAPDHLYRAALQGAWAGLLLAGGQSEEALARANKGLELAGDEIVGEYVHPSRKARIQALLALDRIDEAHLAAGRALDDARRFAPDAVPEVEALDWLGQVERRRGRWLAAAKAFCRGADLLERQVERLGGTADSDARFRSHHHGVFEGCAEARIMLGEPGQAFLVIERARAWKTRQALAERGLLMDDHELAPRLRRLARLHDERLAELTRAAEGDEARRLRRRLGELAFEREQILGDARAADPRLATLAYPSPLGAAEASHHVPPGASLLVFETTETSVLALRLDGSGDVVGHRLDLDPESLERRVDAWVAAIVSRLPRGELEPLAESLWHDLLVPILDGQAIPERLLIMADGALLRLPWAALGRRSGGVWRWAVEDSALTVVPSVTVLGELSRRPPQRGRRVAAFGDSVLQPISAGESRSESGDSFLSLARWNDPLPDLPGSRQELKELEKIFGETVDVFRGADASESQARRLNSAQRIVHFAGHALIDARRPLESGLVLSAAKTFEPGREPDRDNGFLQAWEIVGDLRIDAELVTLSACSTARGAEQSGEGVIGLPRAFLHAGARSVLATLWPVADLSTARLMETFYRHLRDGASRDVALRRAQLELLQAVDPEMPIRVESERGVGGLIPADSVDDLDQPKGLGKHSMPFYWAAFRLVGDPG